MLVTLWHAWFQEIWWDLPIRIYFKVEHFKLTITLRGKTYQGPSQSIQTKVYWSLLKVPLFIHCMKYWSFPNVEHIFFPNTLLLFSILIYLNLPQLPYQNTKLIFTCVESMDYVKALCNKFIGFSWICGCWETLILQYHKD